MTSTDCSAFSGGDDLRKTILCLILFIPLLAGSVPRLWSPVGKFMYRKGMEVNFRLQGGIPKTVSGSLLLKAKTPYREIVVSYNRVADTGEDEARMKRHSLWIKTKDGILNHRFLFTDGKGFYTFTLWGEPGQNGTKSDSLGHFYTENTSDTRYLNARVSRPDLLQFDDSVLTQGDPLPGRILLSGRVKADYLMAMLSRGSERIQPVIRLRDGRFLLPLALRFGPGAYRIDLFAAGKDGLRFNGLASLSVSNSSPDDCRFTAPSPAIQSDAPPIIKLAREITKNETTTAGKVRAVYRWVTGNISYDYKTFFSGQLSHTTALDVLDNKKDICEGYAKLTTALLRAVGIPARIVTGRAFSRSLGNRWMPHAWNQALLGNRWVQLDPTWDAGFLRQGGKLVPRSWKYFMPDDAFMQQTHKPDTTSLE